MPNLIFPLLALLGFTIGFIVYHYSEKRKWQHNLRMRVLELQRLHNDELEHIIRSLEELAQKLEEQRN